MEYGIAVVHDVFHDQAGMERLGRTLADAREGGAQLALLPELPLNPWSPASPKPRDEDAEAPNGVRHRKMAQAAREAGLALLGGAIVRDPPDGRRFNRALLFDAEGTLLGSYDKCHLPSEAGFWESDHYEPGEAPPRRIDGLPIAVGIQICSDANRPEGSQLLLAQGVELIAVPRATPTASYDRWKLVLRANALTTGSYVISTNRPRPENGVEIGGPSLVIAPDGEVLAESTEPLTIVKIRRDAVEQARRSYPGYLATRAELYARAWSELA
jgi:predicted amidohydrolase